MALQSRNMWNLLLMLMMIATTQPARNPAIISGLEVHAAKDHVTVDPGVVRIDGREVRIAQATNLAIDPAATVTVTDEPYESLSAEKPARWAGGTHLRSCIVTTVMPDCLVPGSVVVKLKDGTVMDRDKDYVIDERWACLARLEKGRIAKDAAVTISYRYSLHRLDAIAIDRDGHVALIKGEGRKTAFAAPTVPPERFHLANVYMPSNGTGVEDWQIFPIVGAFPEPDADEIARRAALVPKTLAKLRAGEPVTIVCWGDSVTVGGDVSAHEKMFAELFPQRLRERFPKSKITNIMAGVGATNSEQRLPQLQKDVLDFHPDLVTVEYVNDVGHPEAAVRARYAKIFAQIRAAGAEIILITPHFTMTEMMQKQHPRGGETRPTVQVLRELATEHHVALADTSRRWEHLELEGIPYLAYLYNGINHPDDRGHELFVKDLMTFFPK